MSRLTLPPSSFLQPGLPKLLPSLPFLQSRLPLVLAGFAFLLSRLALLLPSLAKLLAFLAPAALLPCKSAVRILAHLSDGRTDEDVAG